MVTEAERERLVILMEECGEVIQACSKIIRHGWDGVYPDGTGNTEWLRNEIDDVLGMIWAIEDLGDISGPIHSVEEVWERKRRWMHHQGR
jgi:NTP pyrophosphatase (non-canonical NTP hydrolase)